MKQLAHAIESFAFICIVLTMLTSCDIWGAFHFTIINRTDKEVQVSYIDQLRSYEDILPTYDHGDDYDSIRFAKADSIICISPHQSVNLVYDVGLVGFRFPTESDTPESWGIVPLWQRITSIVISSDTIDASNYAGDKWQRSERDYSVIYTLTLY